MKNYPLLIGFLLLFNFSGFAQKPTTHSANVNVQNLKCNELNLSWMPGNGSNRLVLLEKGSTPTFTPMDGFSYNVGQDYGSAKVVFDGAASSFKLTNLDPGSNYIVYIYEFSNTTKEYLTTSGYPIESFTTEELDFTNNRDPKLVCEGTSLSYDISVSAPNNDPVTYSWNFGDGNTSSIKNPTHVYSSYGIYNVVLSATSIGCFDTYIFKDTIAPYPKPDFVLDPDSPMNTQVQCEHINSFTFKNKTVNPSLGTAIDQANITWYFGDGTTSTQYNAKGKHYSDAGSYMVKLLVSINKNLIGPACTDSIQMAVTVNEGFDASAIEDDNVKLCKDQQLTLKYNDNLTGYWVVDGDTTFSNTHDKPISQTGNIDIEFVLPTSTNICGGKYTNQIQVLSQTPTISLGPDKTITTSDEFDLSMPAGLGYYVWSTGETTQTITVNGANFGSGTHSIWAKGGLNEGCTNTDTIDVTVNNGASIEHLASLGLKAYPNPTKDIIKFVLDRAFTLKISDLHGNLLSSSVEISKTHQYNVSGLDQGVYIAEINVDGIRYFYKFYKQ